MKDKYKLVWMGFFFLGFSSLLPWNFYANAVGYFTQRLNQTGDANLQFIFNNSMTAGAMGPLFICSLLNFFLQKIPHRTKILFSLSVIFVIFSMTLLFVKVRVPPGGFFAITILSVILINACGAVLQTSLFSLAGIFPPPYVLAIMVGQGVAGVFSTLAMILTGDGDTSMMLYFGCACFISLSAGVVYVHMRRLSFFTYYTPNGAPPSSSCADFSILKRIFLKIWYLAGCVFFLFVVTIGVYPAILADVASTAENPSPYFSLLACFLIYSLLDFAGRVVAMFCEWPGAKWMSLFVLLRIIFIPLFIFCNVEPRSRLKVVFNHDAFFCLFNILLSFSNGYFFSLCIRYGVKKVPLNEVDVASIIMSTCLSFGLCVGAGVSFAIRLCI